MAVWDLNSNLDVFSMQTFLQAHLSIQHVFQSISLIISPSKFWIATIFLHAHLQVMHYNCVKFHKNPISNMVPVKNLEGDVSVTIPE
jgi:predicted nucleic acid-binding protein